jgi:hypothetical protein
MPLDGYQVVATTTPNSNDAGTVVRQVGIGSAAAAADGAANPTTIDMKAYGLVWNGATWDRALGAADNADGVAVATQGAARVVAETMRFNGTTWDRVRNNVDGTALATATRTAGTVESADIVNYNARGVHVALHYSVGQANLVLRIQGKDALSGGYYNQVTTATISATNGAAVAIYKLYPGISAGAATNVGGSANDVLPRTWRVQVVPSGSPTATYGVGYSMIQ